jgi:1,4-dihydroxy-2-naphthoate polyprenyltransferase
MSLMQKWIAAARLRTLPLAIGGMLLAASLATFDGVFSWRIFTLALITAILLQVLSNFANDYGDFAKGTDAQNRPDRAVASGAISGKSMFRAVILMALLTFLSGIFLLHEAFGSFNIKLLLWLVVGLAAIAAAVKYTMGKNPYGYAGKGDLMVFVFFGLILVWGARYLYGQEITTDYILGALPAIAYGSLCVAVLNVNNIRDIENDKANNKITIAVRFGRKKAVRYQLFLYIISILGFVSFAVVKNHYLSLAVLTLPCTLLFIHYKKVNRSNLDRETYNVLLKKLALLTLLFSLVIFIQMFW